MAATLANHQFRLNPLMPLVLMTDDRKADWPAAARALPHGSLVVIRGKTTAKRVALVAKLHGLAPLLIADDPQLAAEIGAAGLHLPEHRRKEALHWRLRHPHWIITASAHGLRSLMDWRGLDAMFLSPVFATASHRDAVPLGAARAAFIANAGMVPVYALGGITSRNAALLAPGFSGIAAIGSLI